MGGTRPPVSVGGGTGVVFFLAGSEVPVGRVLRVGGVSGSVSALFRGCFSCLGGADGCVCPSGMLACISAWPKLCVGAWNSSLGCSYSKVVDTRALFYFFLFFIFLSWTPITKTARHATLQKCLLGCQDLHRAL